MDISNTNTKSRDDSRITRKKERKACYQTRFTSLTRKLFELSQISDIKCMLVSFDETSTLSLYHTKGNKLQDFMNSYLKFNGPKLNISTKNYKLLKGNDENEILGKTMVMRNWKTNENCENKIYSESVENNERQMPKDVDNERKEPTKLSDYEILEELEKTMEDYI
eukprot:GAHX01001095.1.p1 GENE.GAHX01001095.1~~GAHX01001095.1.p1  ORF type:complete len:166 (-),score=40.10 GAHX01001095.1:40-537(-)